jgi:hypothetical protein
MRELKNCRPSRDAAPDDDDALKLVPPPASAKPADVYAEAE